MTKYNKWYDCNAEKTAGDIISSFNNSQYPALISGEEMKHYVVWHDTNGYALLHKKSEDSEAVAVATEQNLVDFVIAVFKTWTGKLYTAEDIFGTDNVMAIVRKRLNSCTFYWNFMMDTYALFENTGFDNEQTRPLVTEQIRKLKVASEPGLSYLGSILLQYTIEHFIRYTHDTGNMQYLDTMAGLVDFILSRDVSVFIEMVTSYPDMDGIKVEYIAEALSDLKSYMSDIIAPCEGIRQSALIHLKMMSENADYLNLLFDNPRMFHLGFKSLHTNTPYTERNRNFSAGIADVLPGEMAHNRFCDLIDTLLSKNHTFTYKDIYYNMPARWRWNEDKTKILDVVSRAAFEPSFFGPDSKEWKEADEAENGGVFRPLPEDYRTKCDFSSNAMITTAYEFGYPHLYINEHMADITIVQTYQARDGFCSRYVTVNTQDIRERLNEKRICFVTKEVLRNGFDVKTCNRDFDPEKPYDSGWMFFGNTRYNDYINNPDNIEMVDLKSFLEICPKAVSLMEEFNEQTKYEKHEALITDEDGNQTEYTHEEITMSFPMNNEET